MTPPVNNQRLYGMVMSPNASMPRTRRFTGWLILLCAALLLNGLLAHYSVRRLVTLEQSREHLLQRRQAFSELDVGILTAQSSVRGYALTGQSAYLSEHSAALSRVHGALATAKQLGGDEAQRLQLDRLEAHAMKAMSWVQQLMIARQKGGLRAAERMLADGHGVVFVATARAALGQMDDAARERMRAEAVGVRSDLTAAMAYLAVFTVAGIFLTLLVVRMVRREFEHRKQAEQALLGANQIAYDQTDHKRAERALQAASDQLEALSRRLVEIQETERRQLARELHDRVGQNLTALGINLDIVTARSAGKVDGELIRRLEDSRALVDATADAIVNLLSDLRPPMFDDLGLLPALEWYAGEFSTRTGIDVAVIGEEQMRRPPPDAEIALFRIVQEALNNVAKHARARTVDVELSANGEWVLTVSDDGVGLDVTPQPDSPLRSGSGMVTMRERTLAIGGRFEIVARSGGGTSVVVRVPAP